MIGWSWRAGRIAGIDVYVHATLLVLFAWIGVSHYLPHRRLTEAVGGIVFVLAVFGIIVLHELGHALTARHYGIRTRDITLLPIGGVARLERMPDDPKQELVVALAGPAVNVVLAAALFGIVGSSSVPAGTEPHWGGGFLAKLMWVNVALAVFNLVPAFPMDGGRALRALLALRMDYVRATRIAAEIGRGLALVLGLVGLFANPFLVFIALFVWMGATAEAGLVQLKSALSGIPVGRVMVTSFETLAPADTLDRATALVLAGSQHDFPVMDAGQVVGLLTQARLMRALAENGRDGRVASAMEPVVETVDASDMLEGAVQRLHAGRVEALPVLRDAKLVGILTPDNVTEFLMIESALRARGPAGRSLGAPVVLKDGAGENTQESPGGRAARRVT